MIRKTEDSLILHTDLYQLNMMYTYFKEGIHNRHAVFECYFRNIPFKNGYAIFAGLDHSIEYLSSLKFAESDLQYLKDTQATTMTFSLTSETLTLVVQSTLQLRVRLCTTTNQSFKLRVH